MPGDQTQIRERHACSGRDLMTGSPKYMYNKAESEGGSHGRGGPSCSDAAHSHEMRLRGDTPHLHAATSGNMVNTFLFQQKF